MTAIDIDRDTAHEAAQSELAKPIYPRPSLLDRIGAWLDELMNRLILEGSSLPGSWLTIAVLALALLAAVAVSIRIARRALGSARDPRLFHSGTQSAADHRGRSEQYAAEGNWAAAIRQRVRAIGRQLEQDGLLEPAPGRTAGELARDGGRALPGFAAELLRAASIFNDVAYGERPGTEPHYREVADLDDRLRRHDALATTGPAGPAVWTPVR